jgi:hypothetical protein
MSNFHSEWETLNSDPDILGMVSGTQMALALFSTSLLQILFHVQMLTKYMLLLP